MGTGTADVVRIALVKKLKEPILSKWKTLKPYSTDLVLTNYQPSSSGAFQSFC
jgi:hypothetical protein